MHCHRNYRSDGSREFDVYLGGGAGGGVYYGGGVSGDNAGSNNHPGWNISGSPEATAALGVGIIGGAISQPFHTDGNGGFVRDISQKSLGLSAGPRVGAFAGITLTTVMATYKF